MIGTAGLHGLRVECIVGIYEHERQTPQAVIVDIDLDYDFAAAAASDAIGDAIDYDGVARSIADLAQRRSFQLIETMAEETAALVFEQWPSVRRVRLEIRKPAAVPAASGAFVRVDRMRP
ncbi:MAG: dihydroneopterin aldolase [Acidobacteriota bacterium]|nr:dihydroneopterin aldolase [Acidobacteriota bacterium]